MKLAIDVAALLTFVSLKIPGSLAELKLKFRDVRQLYSANCVIKRQRCSPFSPVADTSRILRAGRVLTTFINGSMLSLFSFIYEMHKSLNRWKYLAESCKDEKALDMSRFLLTMIGFLIRNFLRFLASPALKKLFAILSTVSWPIWF